MCSSMSYKQVQDALPYQASTFTLFKESLKSKVSKVLHIEILCLLQLSISINILCHRQTIIVKQSLN